MTQLRPKQIAREGATTGQALVFDGTSWAPATVTGGSGGASGVHIVTAAARTTGAYSTSSASYSDIDSTNLTATIPAALGDILEMELLAANFYGSTSNQDCWITYSIGGQTPSCGSDGVAMWTIVNSGVLWATPSVRWVETVTAPMLSGGNVTVRPRWRTPNGVALLLKADTVRTPRLVVKNLGPAL